MSERPPKGLQPCVGESPCVQLGTLPCKALLDTGLRIFKTFSFGAATGLEAFQQQPSRGMRTIFLMDLKDFVGFVCLFVPLVNVKLPPPSLLIHWERIFLAFGAVFFSVHYF